MYCNFFLFYFNMEGLCKNGGKVKCLPVSAAGVVDLIRLDLKMVKDESDLFVGFSRESVRTINF